MSNFLKDNIGIIYAFGAALLFSFKPVLVKLIYVYDLNAITLLAWRMLVSLPIYLVIGIIIWLKKNKQFVDKTSNKHWLVKASLVGLLGYYLAALFDLQGLQTITAQLERLILFSYPSWVAILSWWLLKKPLGKNILLALMLSYMGIAVILISDWQQLGEGILIGSAWVLLAALSFSFYVVLSKPIIDQLGAKEFTVIAMVSSSAIALLQYFISQPWQALAVPLPAFWLIVTMAILTTVLPTFLLAAAILRIGTTRTAITGTFGPVMTSLFAVVLLDEYFGWPQIVGLAFVIIAVVMIQSKPRASV